MLHRLVFDERYHSVAATKGECPDFQKAYEELAEHFCLVYVGVLFG